MNLKYVIITAVIVIAVAVIGAIFALRILYKPTGPTFNELFTYTSNNTYTANYNYYIYSNIAGQVSTEDYLFTYSQRGLTERYIVVTTTSAPQMSLYIVTTQLSNGTMIQCIAEPLYAGCTSTNQTFNLIYLALPIVNTSSFTLIGKQKILGYNAYCYMSRNTTMLGNVMPSAVQAGLGSIPVNVTSEVCMTPDGVPLLIKLSVFTTLSISGYSAPINITQSLQAINVQDGIYLSNNATALLKSLGVNETG
ncbi:hypothetical protein [Vulcanisaeta distributa]|uniref:Uncharacterized protein n=1 Tax=Vulcanisaeta distributa (strain DSM 14429 / JCM 11212 / NBRC 100878 / IC-017) TaxID=572478 RepID=E1QPZ6_VULDI|nr:hypothetical protein [Vulcanisaeta distributa]ADN50368.1 hypothetical protein Vdis_0978 [Vulcanisaeta distributa DSM 14429]